MKKTVIAGMALALALGVSGEVRIPAFLTDNMVVQRNATLTIPGTARPGAKVTARADWAGGKAETKAGADGAFSLSLPTPGAGGPYTIVISDGGDSPLVLSNILSGEVWLCSGQSNMEFPVKGWTQVMNADEVVATARHPEIRLLQVRKNIAYTPQANAEVNMGGWVEASPATMDFSAIAYFFANRLVDELGVPVGVIDATWGGTPAEAWTSAEWLEGIDGFGPQVASLKRSGGDKGALMADYGRLIEEWNKSMLSGGKSVDPASRLRGDGVGEMPVPGMWEQSVLPGFDGVVWMQKAVNIPAELAGMPGEIFLGPVDNEDETYVNGVKVGGNGAWDSPRHYMIEGSLLKPGENLVTVKVSDYDGDGGIGGSADDNHILVGGQRIPLSGNWDYLVAADFKANPKPVSVESSSFPSVLYNAMIAPLNVMPVKGVLWYQGCANVGRAAQYEPLFQALIRNWRADRGDDSLPFYFVQLAGWLAPKNVQPDSEWASLRESQARALTLPATGMAVAIDLGNPADIHPVNKQEVARRLSLLALNRTYGVPTVDAAPVCVSAERRGDKMVLTFDAPVSGHAGVMTGFIVGDGKGHFGYASTRQLSPTSLELSSPLVEKPAVARYNWADSPGGNLKGETGLPVAPFATDLMDNSAKN